MELNVPLNKDSQFDSTLFKVISDGLTELYYETGKWPDSTIFSGTIGNELYNHLHNKDWDLKKFGPLCLPGGTNKIRIEYSKPLNQIEDNSIPIMTDDLNGRQVNGFMGPEAMAKLMSSYSQPSFKIERTVRPYYEIRLVRSNK
jgi:hypothetical protein